MFKLKKILIAIIALNFFSTYNSETKQESYTLRDGSRVTKDPIEIYHILCKINDEYEPIVLKKIYDLCLEAIDDNFEVALSGYIISERGKKVLEQYKLINFCSDPYIAYSVKNCIILRDLWCCGFIIKLVDPIKRKRRDYYQPKID